MQKKEKRRNSALTVLGATTDPEIQHLIFFGLWGLSGIVAELHPQASPRPCHLHTKSLPMLISFYRKGQTAQVSRPADGHNNVNKSM